MYQDFDAAEALQVRMEQEQAALQAAAQCPEHVFQEAQPDKRLPWKGVYVCALCKVRIRAPQKWWYDQGVQHGRKSGVPE